MISRDQNFGELQINHEAITSPRNPATVKIPVGDLNLVGELIIPANAAGIVLFAHGSGSSRFSPRNQFVARILHQSGIATLLFDLLTREEELLDSRTRQLRFDVGMLTFRLIETTRWIARHDWGKQLGLGYFGASTGGAAALMAAASLGLVIDAVVSRGGRPDLAGNALSRVEAATLLIVGEYDDHVIQLNKEAYAELRCEKELVVVSRATHLFEEPGALEEVALLAANWFQKYLKPR